MKKISITLLLLLTVIFSTACQKSMNPDIYLDEVNKSMTEYYDVFKELELSSPEKKSIENKIDAFSKYKTKDDTKLIELGKSFKEEEKIENALKMFTSTSKSYDKLIDIAKKYKDTNSKEDYEEFSKEIDQFALNIAMYRLYIDPLDKAE